MAVPETGAATLSDLQVIDSLRVGPPRISADRITTSYRVRRGDQTEESELSYRYGEPVFDPADPVDLNLASLIGAQVALNYGLFCKEIVFEGHFDDRDRKFLGEMMSNTAREIYVKKILQPNPFLQPAFRGMPIERVRRQLSGEGGEDPTELGHDLVERAAEVGRLLFEETASEIEVQVAGTDHLLSSTDFAEADRIRSLVATLQDRQRIVREWRRALHHGGPQVLIGHESELTAEGDLGMVATLFYHQGRSAGALGVVGPRRMDYGRIVPVVEFIGDTLTRMLEEGGFAHG